MNCASSELLAPKIVYCMLVSLAHDVLVKNEEGRTSDQWHALLS